MTQDFFPEIEIRDQHAAAIARGLHAVARVDGVVHEREAAMITEFFNATTDHASQLAELERLPMIEPAALAAILPSTALRQLFIKTAILLAHVDNNYSAKEAALIADYAKACGIDTPAVKKLEASVKDFLIGQLSHLQNIDGIAQVAKDLKR